MISHFCVWRMLPLAALLAVISGCSGPLLVSHRVTPLAGGAETGLCDCASGWEHASRQAKVPHRAGPAKHLGAAVRTPPEADPFVQPPPAKFHPVPTRPVFLPRPRALSGPESPTLPQAGE